MKSFRDLRVWSEAIDFAVTVYSTTEGFPSQERFGLSSQLRKAAVSVASNIAEGQGRLTNPQWLHFLGNARGSLYEVETQLVIASRLGYLSEDAFKSAADAGTELGKGLSGLIDYVASRLPEA